MKFGIYLPHHAPSAKYPITPRIIIEFAQKAEELGFHSVWMGDHLVVSPLSYTRSFLDPLTMLAAIAARTKTVKLGTNILVLPLRNPVLYAKEIATLEFLAPGRSILGVASGYNSKEFEAVGVALKERGRRMDECIEIVKRLLSEPAVTYTGKFYQFEDISIEPLPAKCPPIWVGGGSMAPREGIKASAMASRNWEMALSLLERIVRSDGWIARGRSTVKDIERDWEKIKAHARKVGRDPSTLTFANFSYLHIVENEDRKEALRIQRSLFEELVEDPWKYVQEVYLTGTVEEMAENIEARAKIGVELMMLFPVSLDIKQLELWSDEIIPLFK